MSFQISVGFNLSDTHGVRITNAVGIFDDDDWIVYPTETRNIHAAVVFPIGPSSAVDIIVVMTMTPGATAASLSTYDFTGGVVITGTGALSASDAALYGAIHAVYLTVVTGATISATVTPMDAYGNEQERYFALDSVTASMC